MPPGITRRARSDIAADFGWRVRYVSSTVDVVVAWVITGFLSSLVDWEACARQEDWCAGSAAGQARAVLPGRSGRCRASGAPACLRGPPTATHRPWAPGAG